MPLFLEIEQSSDKGIALYGAGFVGNWAIKYLNSIGVHISYFFDGDPSKHGKLIHGIPIVSPDDNILSTFSPVLISARHAVKKVEETIKSKNNNCISLSFDGFYVIKNYEKLKLIRDNYFNDEKSIDTYNAILYSMLTSTLDSCLDVMEKDMYFSLPQFSGTFEETFVDAGAFGGDTVERFIWENLGTFRHIYAFEPGERQFEALKYRMNRLSKEWAFDNSSYTLIKGGLSSKSGSMNFSFLNDFPLRHGLVLEGSEDINAHVSSSEVYSLDEYLNGKPVSFIKADVEGMEMDLLRGAKMTIQNNKPKLSICVYHYPSDLIDIIEFIKSIVPEYKFSIRQHAPIFGDFVLYCY